MLSKNIKGTNLTIVFLQEIKCPIAQIEDLSKKIWKGSEGIGVDAIGYAGFQGILWDPTMGILGTFQGSRCLFSAE